METIAELFDFSRFMPHGMCFLWRWDLLILHVGSDLLIALAYFSIPAAIYTFVRKREDARNDQIALLFVAFILLCGITHVASIVTIWYPAYIIEGLFKLATGIVSLATAIALWHLIPQALAIPSNQQLEARNQEIQQLNRRLQQRIDSLTTLAGGVSHDFNNMLTVIQGHAQLLEHAGLDQEARSSVEAILESTERATDVCRQMLAYSGRGHFVLSRTDINEIISSIEVPATQHCDITYALTQSPCEISAAPEQIRQMVHDLVSNSIEAIDAERGHIQIATSREHLDSDQLARAAFEHALVPGEAIVLEIRDNGVGMPRQVLERIFEPYYSTKFTGRGLGMAAVQGIVRGHGGALFIDTTEHAGTSIRVAFPVKVTESIQYRTPKHPYPSVVLVVDDEPQVMALARSHLTSLGIRVHATTDPEEALRLLQRNVDQIEAVIVDYLMPQITGTELLEEMLEIKEVDAYLTSGYSRGEIDEPLLRRMLTGFIAKPYTRDDFRRLFGEGSRPPDIETGEAP